MLEAWEDSPDEIRQANKMTTFIVFCEDQVIEPLYFDAFNKPGKVKVNTVKNQLSGFRHYVKALAYCENIGLLEEVNEKYVVKSDITNHIWSVYDCDADLSDNPDPLKLKEDKMNFTASIKQAETAGIKVAWSNDVFELWILLHFEEVTPAIAINRHHVYARLTAIFKAFPDQSAEMLKITGNAQFDYKTKKARFFKNHVIPLLASRSTLANQRAEALEAAFNANHRYHEMNPCTKVHHLVKSLKGFSEDE